MRTLEEIRAEYDEQTSKLVNEYEETMLHLLKQKGMDGEVIVNDKKGVIRILKKYGIPFPGLGFHFYPYTKDGKISKTSIVYLGCDEFALREVEK